MVRVLFCAPEYTTICGIHLFITKDASGFICSKSSADKSGCRRLVCMKWSSGCVSASVNFLMLDFVMFRLFKIASTATRQHVAGIKRIRTLLVAIRKSSI